MDNAVAFLPVFRDIADKPLLIYEQSVSVFYKMLDYNQLEKEWVNSLQQLYSTLICCKMEFCFSSPMLIEIQINHPTNYCRKKAPY